MRFNPHDYQAYAIKFIKEHKECAVLLSMGLGKTVITLTAIKELIDEGEVRRVLVIAPLRVARDTWSAEIQKWDHLQGLTYSIAVGDKHQRRAALCQNVNLHIINRENVQWLVEESRILFDYDMIVVDELSSFKSYQAKRFRALMKVRPWVKRIVGLTGTPSSNGLMDLWAEFRVLDMGKRLGRFISRYRDEFFLPDKRNGMQVFSWKPREGAEQEIYTRISDITISMKAIDHIRMPECIMSNIEVRMDMTETGVYEQMKRDMVARLNGEEIDAINAAALSNKLCQMANGAVYADEDYSNGDNGNSEKFSRHVIDFHDRKLDALEDIIEAANGKPLLVAYWFKHDFDRITERLHKLHIPFFKLDSSESIQRWNNAEIPVALIHPASAGHGLNLQQGGSTLVWFGLTWSLELYQQTNARLWRQGQQAETVVIQHIVTKGTIDEQILAALERKDMTQSALMNAVKAQLRK